MLHVEGFYNLLFPEPVNVLRHSHRAYQWLQHKSLCPRPERSLCSHGGSEEDGLFLADMVLDSGSGGSETSMLAHGRQGVGEQLELWHRRLAHLGADAVRKLREMAEGLPIVQAAAQCGCNACVTGKMYRKPFTPSVGRRVQSLDLIRTDVCGPMEVPSIGGSRYFILLHEVDRGRDYTQEV